MVHLHPNQDRCVIIELAKIVHCLRPAHDPKLASDGNHRSSVLEVRERWVWERWKCGDRAPAEFGGDLFYMMAASSREGALVRGRLTL